MKKLKCFALGAWLVMGLTGCITHHVAQDYDKYLQHNSNRNIGRAPFKADYWISEDSRNQETRIHSAAVGIANVWTVNFGDMLDDYLNSGDLQKVFGTIQEEKTGSPVENLLVFDLKKFEFKDYAAHIILNITHIQNDKKISSKSYDVIGKFELGKMSLGGAFAMKNSVQESMTDSLDKIFRQFLDDLNSTISGNENTKMRNDDSK